MSDDESYLRKLAKEIAAVCDESIRSIHIAPKIVIQFYNVKPKISAEEIKAYVQAVLKGGR